MKYGRDSKTRRADKKDGRKIINVKKECRYAKANENSIVNIY